MSLKNIVFDVNILRILGSFFLVLGYIIILYYDVKLGCYFRLMGNIGVIPFSIKIKTWDVVALCTFFSVVDLYKIIDLS